MSTFLKFGVFLTPPFDWRRWGNTANLCQHIHQGLSNMNEECSDSDQDISVHMLTGVFTVIRCPKLTRRGCNNSCRNCIWKDLSTVVYVREEEEEYLIGLELTKFLVYAILYFKQIQINPGQLEWMWISSICIHTHTYVYT